MFVDHEARIFVVKNVTSFPGFVFLACRRERTWERGWAIGNRLILVPFFAQPKRELLLVCSSAATSPLPECYLDVPQDGGGTATGCHPGEDGRNDTLASTFFQNNLG